jgi:protein-disulfide isomerase
MMRKVFPFLLAVLLAAGILAAPLAHAAESGDCVRGNASAPIKIEVFSDFQCPACQAFYLMTMRNVLTEYADTGKVCVAYREFPLQMHSHAREAAHYGHAAMRVSVQVWGKVADVLFQNQEAWAASGDIESTIAKVLSKNDLDALHAELGKKASLDAAIESDINLGTQRGVNSTPTFFVTANGKTEKVAAAVQYQILKRYLDSLLAKGN